MKLLRAPQNNSPPTPIPSRLSRLLVIAEYFIPPWDACSWKLNHGSLTCSDRVARKNARHAPVSPYITRDVSSNIFTVMFS